MTTTSPDTKHHDVDDDDNKKEVCKIHISKQMLKRIKSSYETTTSEARELIETSCDFIQVNYKGNPSYKKIYWNDLNRVALWVLAEDMQTKQQDARILDAINDMEECETQMATFSDKLVCVIEDFEELIEMCTDQISVNRFNEEWDEFCTQYTEEQLKMFSEMVKMSYYHVKGGAVKPNDDNFTSKLVNEMVDEVEDPDLKLKLGKRLKYLVRTKLNPKKKHRESE